MYANLLIVPYGIEISKLFNRKNGDSFLLIVPYGIEMSMAV